MPAHYLLPTTHYLLSKLMSADAFEKTNMGWQVQRLLTQIGEWLELKWPRTQPRLPNLPNLTWNDWLNQPLWMLFQLILWVLLAVLLIRLALNLLHRLEPYFYTLRSRTGKSTRSTTRSSVDYSTQGWFKRSQDFYRQGNYREACRSLYMAMLQRLHDTGLALHQPSRTDGEYIHLIQQLPQRHSYQILLNAHERICFDNVEISSEDFERCQQAYREIVNG